MGPWETLNEALGFWQAWMGAQEALVWHWGLELALSGSGEAVKFQDGA